MTDSVVTAFAVNYQWEQCRTFVKSLRKFYGGDVVVWGRGYTDETLAQFKRYDITLRDHGDIPPDLYANSARFFAYYDMTVNGPWEEYFLFDIRDIVFQGYPLSIYTDGLNFFEEDETFRENAINAAWIQYYWGLFGLLSLLDKRVLCSGTIMGNRESIRELCSDQRYFSSLHSGLIDQAVHNWLFYTDSLKNTVVHSNGFPVWTVGTKPQDDSWYRLDGHLVQTLDGVTPIIVHQFDRHPNLLAAVEAIYAD